MSLLIFLLVAIYSFYYKSKVIKSAKHDGKLTRSQKVNVIITEILSPVIAGAIYYYGWRKHLPIKAQQANKYSWIIVACFVLFILLLTGLGIGLAFLPNFK